MTTGQKGRIPVLDFLRGAAAIEVCANHARRLLLLPYAELHEPTAFDGLFYLVTGYAHQAVVLFFVMSGFFVAGSVHKAYETGSWSWSRYGVQRLSRLWSVLVPCLILTCIWDYLGAMLSGGRGYDGTLTDAMHVASAVSSPPLDHSFVTLLGNVCFLQTVAVDVFGSNLALWSLANEWWYYVLFPLLFLALRPGCSGGARLALILAAVCVGVWLPSEMLVQGGVVWLMGYIAWLLSRHESAASKLNRPLPVCVLIVCMVASLASLKRGGWLASDYTLAACLSLMMPWLVRIKNLPSWLTMAFTGLAEFSYSLYLSHLPLLTFVVYGVLKMERHAPSFASYASVLAVLLAMLLYAAVVWMLFERQTPRLRFFLNGCLGFISRKPAKAS